MSGHPVLVPAHPRSKPLILLSDGTWCGREANTQTNIFKLAEMVGVPIADLNDTDVHVLAGKAWYMHGVGLGSTFIEYVAIIGA